jgi:beta-N-acetylhexosaminidase
MSLGQHFLAALDGTQVSSLERDLILKHKVLGFTLFKRNIESAQHVIELNRELKALAKQAGYDIILAVDQEGGRVFRLPEPFTKIPPMRHWARFLQNDLKKFHELGMILGNEVAAAGFTLDFAPVVDIDANPLSPIIGDRSFSQNPEQVFLAAREVIRGLTETGIIPCLKHFPGHGATTQDSHHELPHDDRSLKDLEKTDLVPYQKLIAENLAPTIMTAHVVYPQIDRKNPATLSKKIIQNILREKIKYNGVIFSDDMLMKAIFDNHDLTQACSDFFRCGGDVVLICEQPELTVEVIGKLEKQSDLSQNLNAAKKRLSALKKRFPPILNDLNFVQITKKNQEKIREIFPA